MTTKDNEAIQRQLEQEAINRQETNKAIQNTTEKSFKAWLQKVAEQSSTQAPQKNSEPQ
jgi:predicted acetyltransferase